MNAGAYQENIEYSSNFNTRLCIERRLRLPFFDPQTGVAQNHCSLFMGRRQRMPGFRNGQIYSYPAARWRKHRRQYLSKMLRPFSSIGAINPATVQTNGPGPTSNNHHLHRRLEYANNDMESDFNGSAFLEESSSLGGADTDSQHIKEDIARNYPTEWFYDEYPNEIDGLEEPKSPVDDEYDYDPRYGNKKRRKRRQPTQKLQRGLHHAAETPRKGRQSGGASSSRRGRRKNAATDKNAGARDPSPPSFASAAASSIEQNNDESLNGDLYRKYM